MRLSPTSDCFAGTSDAGQSEAESNITSPGKTNLMSDEVEFNNCFIVPKHTLVSSQLQISQGTCNNDKISHFPCWQVLV